MSLQSLACGEKAGKRYGEIGKNTSQKLFSKGFWPSGNALNGPKSGQALVFYGAIRHSGSAVFPL
jgi:hypothetical protein